MSIIARLQANNITTVWGNSDFVIKAHAVHFTCHDRASDSELGRGTTALAAALDADHRRCDVLEALARA